jgi:hypothetical protein
MASTAKRWAAAGTALLGTATLAAGCQDGTLIADYVQRVFDLQCQRIFSCCAAEEQERFGFGATEAACREDRGRFEQIAVNAILEDIDANLTVVNEPALASCLTAIEASTCQDYFASRTRNCERAFTPRAENGEFCSSNLACRGGLCVGFVCTGDTRPLRAECSSDDDCSSSSCVDGRCAVNPSFVACDGSRVGK